MAKVDKNFFNFVKGLNTEVSPLNFPDQTALDLDNFELRVSGELRRRRGNSLEQGGANVNLVTIPGATAAFSKFTWHSVGGDAGRTFIVVQHGNTLHYYDDDPILSTNKLPFTTDLTTYSTNVLFNTVPCTFTEGRTKLFVANQYMNTIYIDYIPGTPGTLTVEQIDPMIRNFEDAPDDVPLDAFPEYIAGPPIVPLSDTHFWNLKIRGWRTPDINAYGADSLAWPAKNMIWHQGYKRVDAATQSASTVNYEDWTKEWDSAKLEAELFSNSSGPRGSLFLDPYDTTSLTGGSAANTVIAISTWTVPTITAPVWFLTITTVDPHTRVPGDEIDILNTKFSYVVGGSSARVSNINVEGAVCLAGTGGNTIKINIPKPAVGITAFVTQYQQLGYVNTTSLLNPFPYTTTERASAIAYWAGRIFISGMNHPKLSDLVMFSQVADDPMQYAKMYQANDPTSPNASALLANDGGVIQIPGMGTCLALKALGNSLLVFGSTGVWEISGGQTYFAANGYGVRKLSDVECLSALGVTTTDFGAVFTSPRGVYILTGDEQSSNLTAQSLTENSIQTKWNAIPDAVKPRIQLVYDDALKRIRMLYSDTDRPANPYAYDKELVFDTRLGAWFPYTFPLDVDAKYITGVLTTDSSDNSNENKKTKYFVLSAGTDDLDICDMFKPSTVTTKFLDFNGLELLPTVTTGYDNLGDFHTKRQSPFIHVFMRRTEDGFFVNGLGQLETLNPSGLLMQSRFDWSDNSASGKWGTAQQVYRIRKIYIPVDVNDTYDNGEPVNVAKVKVRGQGRSLHLKFTGVAGKDASLLGWSILYRTTRDNNFSGTRER